MNLSHRAVEDTDLATICGFPQSAEELFFLFPPASHPLTPAQLQEAVGQRADSTVVLNHGAVVGFANFHQVETGSHCAIGNVVVAPPTRGHGVGSYLIRHMSGLAFARHRAREVRISCFNRNVAGLLLYPQLGFQPYAVEERRDPQGGRIALIHLRLRREAFRPAPA